MRYEFIDQNRDEFEVAVMCQLLQVSRSGYYAWRKRGISQREIANNQLVEKIRRVYHENRQVYGGIRVWKALKQDGIACGRDRVARLMRANGWRGKRLKRRVRTTVSDDSKAPAPNLLNRQFKVDAPNLKWVGDITYIPTGQGWLFLAVVIDLYSRKVIGWAMANHMRTALVCDAFKMAVRQRQPGAGLLFHSDRGSQYSSDDFRQLLADTKAVASMSRRGNCLDNAVAESFFATLKTELIDAAGYATRAEAETDIFFYIEGFYNRRRLHSHLAYRSPTDFEAAGQRTEKSMTTVGVH